MKRKSPLDSVLSYRVYDVHIGSEEGQFWMKEKGMSQTEIATGKPQNHEVKSGITANKDSAPEKSEAESSCACCVPQTIKRAEEKGEMTTETLHTTELNAPDIVCGGCANAIKNAVGKLEGVSQVEVDVEKKRVTIKHDQKASRELLVDALDCAGFPAS